MTGKIWLAALTAALLAPRVASAATVEVDVADARSQPLADAVVELVAAAPARGELPFRLPTEAVIDQRHETFLPLVSLVRQGGRVIFTNHDTTMHQVYSFSPIKQFAFEIDEGERSLPVVFDKPGVAAIGCNIHDHMITYVYVAASPWTAMSDGTGRATIEGPPPGTYRGSIWHPRLVPGETPPSFSVLVSADGAKTVVHIPVLSLNPSGKKPMHMQMY